MDNKTIDFLKLKIENTIEEADEHVYRFELARAKLKTFFPLTVEKMSSFSDSQVETLDQFIYRFTKLQDCVGSNLFSALFSITQPIAKAVPFLDILHSLEKLSIIDSAEKWLLLRNIRNELSHEYPSQLEETVKVLNALFEHGLLLVQMYQSAKKYYIEKIQCV